MTKQHFIAFAKDINETVRIARNTDDRETFNCALRQAELVCRIARKFNSSFDEDRFMAACDLKTPFVAK